jgi:hypothetical protein
MFVSKVLLLYFNPVFDPAHPTNPFSLTDETNAKLKRREKSELNNNK